MWISMFPPHVKTSCEILYVCPEVRFLLGSIWLWWKVAMETAATYWVAPQAGLFTTMARESQQPTHFVNQPLPLHSSSLRPPRWPPPLRRPPTATILKRRGQTHRHCSHIQGKWQWGSPHLIPLPVCHAASQHTVTEISRNTYLFFWLSKLNS